MAQVEKTVRFFDTVVVDDNNVRKAVEDDFWSTLIDAIEKRELADRSAQVYDVEYIGHAVKPKKPSLPHLQIERIRDLNEMLNVSDVVSGDVEPLDLDDPNKRVSEPTFLVPLASHGRVAVMSPAVQPTRAETLGRWLTAVLGLVPKGYSLELIPVVDPEILEKITGADGAVMLEVHVDPGVDVPSSGGGVVGDAFRSAQKQELEEARLVLRWSLGRSGGPQSVRAALRDAALWVAQNGFSANAKVKLASFDQDGRLVRDEVRAIFDDRVARKVTFQTHAGERTPDEVILNAIATAILEFRQGSYGKQGPAGVSGIASLSITS